MNYLKPLLVIAGIMLLLAVPSIWVYGYYQIMRVVVCVAALYGTYTAFHSEQSGWVWLLGATAILFNPVAPIHLDKEAWIIPDVIAGLLMFVAAAKIKQHG
jgi:hypothetical protein